MPFDWTSQQRLAIEKLNRKIVVSASAGSGKTTVMIARILQKLINERVPIDKMLIATFTRSAAADIREKLTHELLRTIDAGEGDTRFLLEQLERLPMASIGTLHSFCQGLIKKNFFALDISADFEIMGKAQAAQAGDAVLSRLIKERLDDPMFATFYRLFLSGRSDWKLKAAVKSVYEAAMKEKNPMEWLLNATKVYHNPQPLFERNLAHLRVLGQQYTQILDELSHEAANRGFNKSLSYLSRLYEQVSFTAPSNSFTLSTTGLSEQEKQFVLKIKPVKKDIAELIKDSIPLLTPMVSSGEVVKQLTALSAQYLQQYNDVKRAKSELEYCDLEQYAYKLLEQGVECGFKYVFVDEYQDISPIQDEIIERASQNASSYFVGDVKQSIYGFRLCRPEIFLHKFSSLDDGALRFNNNFRSSAKILDFCNQVFCGLMTQEFGQVNYSRDAQLVSGLEQQDSGEVSFVLSDCPVEQPMPRPVPYSVRNDNRETGAKWAALEAEMCAHKINELLGKKEEMEGEVRHWQADDITILLRTNEQIPLFKEVLERHDIPVSAIAKGAARYGREVGTLISLLNLIDNSRQDLPLIETLKGLIYGFSNQDLLWIRKAADHINSTYADMSICEDMARQNNDDEKYFINAVFTILNAHKTAYEQAGGGSLCEYIQTGKQVVLRLEEVFYDLERWKKDAAYLDVPELIAKIIEETDYFSKVIAIQNGAAREAVLEAWLAEMMAKYKGKPLTAFTLAQDDASTSDNPPNSSGAVRVMTMHAAKGLEFPCVLLCGLGRSFSTGRNEGGVVIDSDFGIALATAGEADFVTASLMQKTKEREREEELRLLYVALTRARKRLYLVCATNSVEQLEQEMNIPLFRTQSYMQWLWRACKGANVEIISQLDVAQRIDRQPRPLMAANDAKRHEMLNSYLSYSYPHSNIPLLKTSVTQVLRQELDGEEHERVLFDDYAGEAKNAAEIGNAYHAVMQHIDLGARDVVGELMRLQQLELITAQQAALVDKGKIERALACPLFQNISAKKLLKERKFILNIPYNRLMGSGEQYGVLVQGVIDLIIIDEDGAIVVDYKTTRANAQRLKEIYSRQLELYAYALNQILGVRVKALQIYSFYLDCLVDIQ